MHEPAQRFVSAARHGAGQGLLRACWALCALGVPSVLSAQATFLGEVALTFPADPRFGGLSAVEVLDGGATALVMSDRTTLFTVALERGAEFFETGAMEARSMETGAREDAPPEAIIRARVCCGTAITWADGMDLPSGQRDSEGLALLPDGRLVISFEGGINGRVAYHSRAGVQLSLAPPIPIAAELPRNGGFEGVAVDASGRPYTIPEAMPSSLPSNAPRPLLRLDNGTWQVAARLRSDDAEGAWSPVALDFDPEGRLYLLERRVLLPLGFAARLTRFDLDASGALSSGELILQTGLGQHGNLEGLSLWRDATGRLIATLVSDDDFMAFRASTLVEYILPD